MLPWSEQLLRHNSELDREDLYFWMNSPGKGQAQDNGLPRNMM